MSLDLRRLALVDVPLEVSLQRAILDRLGFAPFLSPEEQQRLKRLREAEYVFVFNDGPERLICGRCGATHLYLTLMCLERPFRGIEHGLYAYYSHVGARAAESMTPEQQRKLNALAPVFGRVHQAASFATSHPQSARALQTGENDEDLCAVLLGTLDPIDLATARKYAIRINMRAGRDLVRL